MEVRDDWLECGHWQVAHSDLSGSHFGELWLERPATEVDLETKEVMNKGREKCLQGPGTRTKI